MPPVPTTEDAKAHTLIAVPTYNEEATIADVLSKIRQVLPSVDILVVNDGSSDATMAVVEGLGIPQARLPCNLGYGHAVQTAIKFARLRGYSYLVLMDADGQHEPQYVPDLLQRLTGQEYDLVIGSRYITTKSYRDVPLDRRLGMLFFSYVTALLTGRRIYDTTSGMKALNVRAMEALLHRQFEDYHSDAIVYLVALGYRVVEVPVIVRERQHGASMYSLSSLFWYPLKTLLLTLVGFVEAILVQRRTGS